MDKNTNKVSNLYGRARRIALVEKIIYGLVVILIVVILAIIIFNREEKVDKNVNFAYLRDYLEGRGYKCEVIHRIGGSCTKTGTVEIEEKEDLTFKYTYTFIRYDDGFEYIINSRGYILDIRHKSGDDSRISFKTTNYAFQGYRNQTYTCSYKDNVISELGECESSNGEVMDVESYISVIKQAMIEVNNMIDNSGYEKDVLLNEYKWEKDESK